MKRLEIWVLVGCLVVGLWIRSTLFMTQPPSLNLDEVAIGYNAYSILTTGRDEYGERFPIAFRSHDDYKAPAYIYLVALTQAVIGPSQLSVRLPALLFGVLMIAATYLLASQVFAGLPPWKRRVAVLTATILITLSPWHIQYSRAAYETGVAATLVVLGIWMYLKGLKQPWWWLGSIILFSLSLYTYHSVKIFLPVMLPVCLWMARDKLRNHLLPVGLSIVIGILMITPLVPFQFSQEGQIRFKGTSVFNTPTAVDRNREQMIHEWRQGREFVAKTFHNHYYSGLKVLLKGYFSHVSYEFLFLGESGPPKNQTPNVGLLYWFELPLLMAGFVAFWKLPIRYKPLLIAWFLAVPIASAFTWDAPNATRTVIWLPTFQLLAALGFVSLIGARSKLPSALALALPVVSFFGLEFYHNYFRIAPLEYAEAWQYGYRQAVEITNELGVYADKVVVSTNLRQPHNFFAFYSQYPPSQYLAEGGTVSGAYDETGNRFGDYEFRPIDWNPSSLSDNTIYVDYFDHVPSHFIPYAIISLPNGEPSLVVYWHGQQVVE